jgi:hypothetical protein
VTGCNGVARRQPLRPPRDFRPRTGKLAEFVVLDRDPLTVPEDQLLTMQFDQTWLGGKLVYERVVSR